MGLEGHRGLTKDELEAMIDLQKASYMQAAEGREKVRAWRLDEADDVSLANSIAEDIPEVLER